MQENAIRIVGDIAYVPLSQGFEAVIDASDVPLVLNRSWYVQKSQNTNYAMSGVKKNGKRTTELMHRLIAMPPKDMEVDHIDGDGLNNRRSNLRCATKSQNQRNSRRNCLNTSGFKGVHWYESKRRWQAQIMLNKKQHHLGYFKTAEEAHSAYVAASERLHGEFGRTN